MSTPEKSTIKPNVKGTTPSGEGIKFRYSTAEFDSYAKQGLTPPDPEWRPDRKERQFLSQIDISQGKIKVKITRMYRLMAIDYTTEKEEKKEYLVWESDWFAKNYMGAEINPIRGHIEGKYREQTLRLTTESDPKTGKPNVYYVKDIPRDGDTIHFSKSEVDKVLQGEHPFGPDSINMTDPDRVVFYGKFGGILGVQSFRCNDYTYQQFVVPEWRQFLELATKEGGPANRKYVEERGQFIT